MLWIALKFFVLLQSKQLLGFALLALASCELLSNFLYFCSRNNSNNIRWRHDRVVNCSQIFCTFAVETTKGHSSKWRHWLWIALKFFVLLQSKQRHVQPISRISSCELLSNFLYFCSRNNFVPFREYCTHVVNCSQIFCTFAVETTFSWNEACRSCCELLSNFLYFCSRNNTNQLSCCILQVVNCSQIFCTFAVETTRKQSHKWGYLLWIALKFFVLLQSKQLCACFCLEPFCCELLSNFLYFCSRNNYCHRPTDSLTVVNCSQIFCTFAVETTF